jgi:DNA mismatch endonuclease (patch repair protein)
MADRVTAERRSAMMSSVRGKHTTPELLVRKAAHRLGLRFRLHDRRLPGRPDLVFPKWKTAVFVNGCFWHRHSHCRKASNPKTNRVFWQRKFKENVRRDLNSYACLTEMGWKVVILWECEVPTVEQASAVISSHFQRSSA